VKRPLRGNDHSRISRAAPVLGLDLSDPVIARLVELAALLRADAVRLGLVGEGDTVALLERHVLDSLRVAPEVAIGDRSLIDVGSGAGLPGLVIATALPHLRVELVEPRRRAVAFLELAIERLGTTNALVTAHRVDEIGPRAVDLVTARAFAPLERSWALAAPLLRPGGRMAYFAGARQRVPEGVPEASSVDLSPGVLVDSSGPLVIITRQ
jgi:16S rRNA (guanine(527)-N(7))-methyltransferase RsmG